MTIRRFESYLPAAAVILDGLDPLRKHLADVLPVAMHDQMEAAVAEQRSLGPVMASVMRNSQQRHVEVTREAIAFSMMLTQAWIDYPYTPRLECTHFELDDATRPMFIDLTFGVGSCALCVPTAETLRPIMPNWQERLDDMHCDACGVEGAWFHPFTIGTGHIRYMGHICPACLELTRQ